MSAAAVKPRLGFLGVGWIGRHRLEAVAGTGIAEIAAVADAVPELAASVVESLPGAVRMSSLGELLAAELDGLVIATPSALHAEQAVAALEQGVAVFCQKPLARNAAETRRVIEAARRADRLLGVDMSYRHTAAMRAVRELVRTGRLGDVYAAELVFHNAYGPDKPWFYERSLSGGGCVMDLGIHLVDLALWVLADSDVSRVSSALFSGGRRLRAPITEVEDFASIELQLASGAQVRITCSWNLNAGRDAAIEASFYGTRGGASMRNVGGSFYDFIAEHYVGTSTKQLCGPPDAWGGRAAVAWARRLGESPAFDPDVEELARLAEVLDQVYG